MVPDLIEVYCFLMLFINYICIHFILKFTTVRINIIIFLPTFLVFFFQFYFRNFAIRRMTMQWVIVRHVLLLYSVLVTFTATALSTQQTQQTQRRCISNFRKLTKC